MKLGYGELALKEETDGMAEINLWDLIVVKLSELGILKRYLYIIFDTCFSAEALFESCFAPY